MLKPEQEGQKDGHAVIEAKEWRRLGRLLHEGKVGPEQKGIVVSADEPLLGEKSLLESAGPIGQGPLGLGLRGDLGGTLVFVHGAGR